MGKERAEFFLVEAFLVGLLRRDAPHAQVFQDGVIQRLVANLLANLDHTGNLVSFALAHEIGNGCREHENFERSDAPLLVNSLE